MKLTKASYFAVLAVLLIGGLASQPFSSSASEEETHHRCKIVDNPTGVCCADTEGGYRCMPDTIDLNCGPEYD
jgi:hypothetical protein